MGNRNNGNRRRLTPKQQKFCEVYVETGNASEAYRQSYDAAAMSAGAIRVNASRLKDNPHIVSRCDELRQQKAAITLSLAERLEISMARTLSELAKIAYANVFDYLVIDANGSVSIDLAKISPSNAAGVSELIAEEHTVGLGADARVVRRTKIKMADKKAALVALLNYLVEAEKSRHAEQRSVSHR